MNQLECLLRAGTARSPVWVGGERIAFIQNGDEGPRVWELDLKTGEATQRTFGNERIWSIHGDARTGVAISDLLCTLVGSATVVPSRNTEKAIADIVRLAQENQVGEIVVGLPKNMDGTEGVRAELCREFADKLAQATGLPVSMWDERRTTVEAHNILSQHNYHGKKRKDTVDAVAASLILEGYLAYKKRNG